MMYFATLLFYIRANLLARAVSSVLIVTQYSCSLIIISAAQLKGRIDKVEKKSFSIYQKNLTEPHRLDRMDNKSI